MKSARLRAMCFRRQTANRQQKNCECDCAGCRGLKFAHPKWGYDRRKVAGIICGVCGKKIGKNRYKLDAGLARFGSMTVVHAKKCARGKKYIDP